MSQLDSAKSLIRQLAKSELGKCDAETCFEVATILWLSERQTGFHRARPTKIPELRLDDAEPVE